MFRADVPAADPGNIPDHNIRSWRYPDVAARPWCQPGAVLPAGVIGIDGIHLRFFMLLHNQEFPDMSIQAL